MSREYNRKPLALLFCFAAGYLLSRVIFQDADKTPDTPIQPDYEAFIIDRSTTQTLFLKIDTQGNGALGTLSDACSLSEVQAAQAFMMRCQGLKQGTNGQAQDDGCPVSGYRFKLDDSSVKTFREHLQIVSHVHDAQMEHPSTINPDNRDFALWIWYRDRDPHGWKGAIMLKNHPEIESLFAYLRLLHSRVAHSSLPRQTLFKLSSPLRKEGDADV